MTEKSTDPELARRTAEERLAKTKQRQDAARKAWDDQEKLNQAAAAKTVRLRALRLAKEAADKVASHRAAAGKAASAKITAAAKAAGRRNRARLPDSQDPAAAAGE